MIKTENFYISGMRCSNCAKTIEKELNKLEGVKKITVDHAKASALVEYDDDKVKIGDIYKAVKNAGYTAKSKT